MRLRADGMPVIVFLGPSSVHGLSTALNAFQRVHDARSGDACLVLGGDEPLTHRRGRHVDEPGACARLPLGRALDCSRLSIY
jgi:CTP:molybdopterin cytidylyltransferase MocA